MEGQPLLREEEERPHQKLISNNVVPEIDSFCSCFLITHSKRDKDSTIIRTKNVTALSAVHLILKTRLMKNGLHIYLFLLQIHALLGGLTSAEFCCHVYFLVAVKANTGHTKTS